MTFKEKLEEGMERLKIPLFETEVLNKLETFYIFFKQWNEKINLSALREEDEIIEGHFLDSFALNKYIEGEILDIGSGGGFPAIPLAIANPLKQFTLVESIGKKGHFLENAKKEIGINNMKIVNKRAEELADDLKNRFDCGTARAVASLSVTMEYVAPFLKTGGIFIGQKTADYHKELEKCRKCSEILGMNLKKVENLELPFKKPNRSIILFEKIGETPKKFPRKIGVPKKSPL